MVGDMALIRSNISQSSVLYQRGICRIESRNDVLGGEPVFRGTRLSVRHIGGMVLAGVPVCEIREDYPTLSEDDINFAALYAAGEPVPSNPIKPIRIVQAADA